MILLFDIMAVRIAALNEANLRRKSDATANDRYWAIMHAQRRCAAVPHLGPDLTAFFLKQARRKQTCFRLDYGVVTACKRGVRDADRRAC